ncbi:winged helix-turn-helix domain-containing protein [Enterobacter roggenkampii]|uniref:winged helix-turn-helix domain-containing protein n=1 Tax=Enterobacter roggenkampii TaxID=1812935 RepID=UPI002DBA5557|nr:winged helix-turn-helix domain-containing protein [Enterobacter roggenkampii]MEB6622473.1 winged helix-turn-helix domain-containing protein [Enterobacter roggenkampii]
MIKKFIVNDKVIFIPDENRLSPLGTRGPEVILNAPVSRFLFLLLVKNGSVAPQDEILREVWEKHGQLVTLNTLYQNVSLLRKALKKAGVITTSIRTHPKVGFSFRGKIQVIEQDDIPVPGNDKSVPSSIEHLSQETIKQIPHEQTTFPEDEIYASASGAYPLKTSSPQGKKHSLLFISLLCVAVAAATFWVASGPSSDKHFTVEHQIVARINQCPLYVDKGNSKTDLSRIISYLKDGGITCAPDEFLYLTRNLHREDLLLFTCSPGTDEELKCVASRKLPAYLYPK